MRISLLAALVITMPAQAFGESREPVVLWRDLNWGDAPEAVASKLALHPSIRSAKPKAGPQAISIRYRGDGIDILGHPYRLLPEFEQGRLRRVSLGTQPLCANRAVEDYEAMIKALTAKYATILNGGSGAPSRAEIGRAFAIGTDENPVGVSRYLTDGKIVVMYQQRFIAEAPPPSGYTSNQTANALGRLLWNQYESRVRECDGTGNHKVQHMLIYMAKPDLDAALQAEKDGDRQAMDKARSNL